MTKLVTFPKIGANVVEGTVGVWRRREGESVRAGDPLVEIITSKATFEIESPAHGVLRKVFAPEKSNVPIGYILGVVGGADDEIPDVCAKNERLLADFRAQAGQAGDGGSKEQHARIRATPGARRLARELGIELTDISPPLGRNVITENDVKRSQEN